MLRLLVLAAIACLVCRAVFGKWPWEYLAGKSSRARELADARHLLGVGPSADAEDIREAYRGLAARIHPDRGGSNRQLQQANAARDLLLAALHPKDTEPQ